METDNFIGKVIFAVVRQMQKRTFARRAVLSLVSREQQGLANPERGMSLVLWDMFTGSAPYSEVFLRTFRPVFWTRLLRELLVSFWPQKRVSPTTQITDQEPATSTPHIGAGIYTLQLLEEYAMEIGGLGKLYQDGEIVIRQGEMGDNMFVIQEGQVEIVVEQDGQEVRLAVQGAGQPIGEMAIFQHQVRSATVRALGQARILTVDKKRLLRRIHEDPSLAYYMMQTMSQRVRELNAEVVRRERRQPRTDAAVASLPDSTSCPYVSSVQVGATMCRPPVVLN